jgi:CDP-diacylglycerol--glycerol-3-phosphate 3-phosphatidyltransferase
LLNLPNILTLARFAAAPMAFWLLVQHWAASAFLLFVAASLTDALDGFLARRWGGSALGAVIDPVADKLLIVTMSVALAATGALPAWLVLLVISRDVLIGVGYLIVVSRHRFVVRPFWVSKINTVLQMALVSSALLQQGFGVRLGDLAPATTASKAQLTGAIAIAPPSALSTPWARRFPDPVDAFASGWMRIRARARQQGVELPLILSDHADWDELTATIAELRPGEVWITHGREEALARWCALNDIPARALALVGYEDEQD